MSNVEIAMYALPELVAETGHFGGVDLIQQRGTIAELAQICQAWGAALAALHTTPVDGFATPLAARPWVVNPEHRATSMRGGLGLGYAAVLNAYEYSSDLRAAAREVDERWTELHWIHGNLNATNVVVDHQPALRVSFVDRDGVGLGDPAWDLASAADMIAWLSPRWHAPPQPLVDYVLLGYRRAGGPGRLYPAMQAVRALATAMWIAAQESADRKNLDTELGVWLHRARAYAARVGCLMAVA